MSGPSRDSKSDLLDAARAAVKDREAKAAEAAVAGRPKPRRMRIGLLVVIGVAGTTLLIVNPVWLSGPVAPPAESAPVAAASLRLSLLRQRQRVFDYRKSHGRLPLSAVEIGDSMPGVRYELTSDSGFRLSGRVGDSLLVLQSTDSAAAFLGNSIKILKNRGRK